MSSTASQTQINSQTAKPVAGRATTIADLVLVRIASDGGATRNMVTRDLAPFTANKLSPAEWRRNSEAALGDLESAQLITSKRTRLVATERGVRRAAAFLDQKSVSDSPWQVQRDIFLVAKALGLGKLNPAKRKQLGTPEGLRALIVQSKFELPAKKAQSPAKLRAALAVVALERAFGKKIKAGLGDKTTLPAKASRLLAGQLLDPVREFSTDTQLIAHIAADQVDARQTSIDELRQALISQLAISLLADKHESAAQQHVNSKQVRARPANVECLTRKAANDVVPMALQKKDNGEIDLSHFSRIVNATASSCAEGWPGNMKAFISRVWNTIRDAYPEWNLSERAFKSMLVDAHRAGTVLLTGADLKNKTDLEDFEKSQTEYKNTVWHFIRVDA